MSDFAMKIFLDLNSKLVQIIDTIGFDDLEELKKFLGDDYKSWKIEPNGIMNHQPHQPTIPDFIQPFNPIIPNPPYWGGSGVIVTTTGSTSTGHISNGA